MPAILIILLQRPGHFEAGGTASKGFWHPYGPLWPCWLADEVPQDGKHGVSTLPLPGRNVCRLLHLMDDSGRTHIPGTPATSGVVNIMRSGVGCGVPTDPMSDPEWSETGGYVWDTNHSHPPSKETHHYQVYLPKTRYTVKLSVEGCHGRETSRTNPRIHFLHCQVRDTILILGEGKHPLHWWLKREMFLPQRDINEQQITTEICRKGEEHTLLLLTAE